VHRTLVGEGALNFYKSLGNSVAPQDELISQRARQDWEYWTDKLQTAEASQRANANHQSMRQIPQDTVGAIACDSDSFMAAGVSR